MGWIVSGADARADQDENLRRLGSMPLEHRRALAQNLERFDAMGAADREAIRALDRELAGQPDAEPGAVSGGAQAISSLAAAAAERAAGCDRRRPARGTDGARHQAPCRGTRLGGATSDSRVPPGGRSRGHVPLRRGAMAENLVRAHPRRTREVREEAPVSRALASSGSWTAWIRAGKSTSLRDSSPRRRKKLWSER